MLGLTFEKLLLVGLVAAVVIGPQRLPGAVARLASVVRGLRRTVDAARVRAATELGVPAEVAEWRALDPRQYDPRRIIAEVFAAPPVAIAAEAASGRTLIAADPPPDPTDETGSHAVAPDPQERPDAQVSGVATAPLMRRVRVGTSAHPRWIVVPADDTTTPDEAGEASSPPKAHRTAEAEGGPASVGEDHGASSADAVVPAVGRDTDDVDREGGGRVRPRNRQLAG